jgi:hypothetical protein
VLKLTAPEPKEQLFSAEEVDCRDSLEGQTFRHRDQMTERNRGLKHAQELFGKVGPAFCYCCFDGRLSRVDCCNFGLKVMIIVRWSRSQGMSK